MCEILTDATLVPILLRPWATQHGFCAISATVQFLFGVFVFMVSDFHSINFYYFALGVAVNEITQVLEHCSPFPLSKRRVLEGSAPASSSLATGWDPWRQQLIHTSPVRTTYTSNGPETGS